MEYESQNARDLEEARPDVNNELPLLDDVERWKTEIEEAQKNFNNGENCD